MLPPNTIITELTRPIDQAQRQTNYLILRTLEHKLDPALFTNLLQQVSKQMDLPEHTAWDGKRLPCSYLQLKESQAASDSHLLSDLVMNLGQKNIENFDESTSPTITTHLKSQLSTSQTPNLYSQFHWQLAKTKDTLRKIGSQCAFSKFDRVKTVFCHTDFATDEVSAIYNVYFDQKGSFIVSAGDEGIIKVWDRDTLTLQASLHGHDDYITEIDISKCNRFIASAGKDAQIIIWELATGKLLYRLANHTKLINCVKFFTPKPSANPNAPQQQYLFSASDDGTVRLYDLTPKSAWAQCKQQKQDSQTARTSEEDQYRVRRSSRQQRVSSAGTTEDQDDLFSIELTPDEFRPGTRNKKLDTLVMNHQGLVIAGSSSCELLVWRLNYDLISKRIPKQDCYKFLGQFKMSRQSCVKFCEFSPKNGVLGVGDTLMAGSGDGVINLWNMNVGQWRSQKENSFNLEDKSRLILTIDEARGCRKTREVRVVDPDGFEQIEYILEDVQQEGIQFKEIANFSKSVCDCVRWSCNGRFAIASVQCQIEGEENDFCRVKIWDTVELTFIEDLSRISGIRLPKNTFVLEAHPTQEEILVTGSDTGVLALWNLHTKQLLKQFKQYGVYSIDANIMDNPLHGSWSRDGNAYISGNSLGTISLYSIEDVHHQYEATRVQQFFQFDITRQPDNPFEKITEKPTICGFNMMPYEVQPERLRIRFTELDPNFNSANFQRSFVIAKELGRVEERYYQDKLQSSLFNDGVNANLQPMDSIQVSQIQPEIYDAGDVDMSDVQIVEQLQDNNQQQLQRQRSDPRRSRLHRNNRRITSSDLPSDDEASSNSDVVRSSSSEPEDAEDSEHRMHTRRRDRRRSHGRNHVVSRTQFTESQRLQRPQRAARPANLRDTETVGDENSVPRPANNRATRNRARRISSSQSDEAEQSDNSEVQRHRHANLYQQTGSGSSNRNRRRNVDMSSPDQIQSASRSAKTRRGLQQTEDYLPNDEAQRGNFYLSDHDLTHEPDDKQDYSSHMLIAATKLQSHKMEHNYELIKSTVPQQPMPCNLCKRTDGEIVGPFGHTKKSQIWLHKDCIEVNTYSYFSITHKKWVNIDTMMKQLMADAQYCCYRCESFGASVSCITCGKNFHGYFCAGVYLIPSATGFGARGGEGTNSQFWQCLFCKNQENYETTLSLVEQNPPSKDQKPFLQALKKIEKAHLITDQSHQAREFQGQHAITYMPQIDDVLLYFFQGHEDYVYQYNCHFYAGQQSPFPKHQTMPWFSPETKKMVTSEPTCLCKVVSITTLFPSQRSLRLISHFGSAASEMTQVPQMIQRVELEFISNREKFVIDIFQNELPDFLVLYQVFLPQQTHYTEQSLVGKEFSVKLKSKAQRVKIIEDSPAEPNFSPNSLWQTLLCAPVQQINFDQRRQVSTQIEQNFRVSFWDIVFPEAKKVDLHGFKEHEFAKLKSYLQTYMQKNKEYLIYFKERVQEKIAFEYRQIIPQEMWFDLLYSRLQNKYYRSSRQFFEDLQLIASNAAAYNGEKHEVAVDALELVRKFKFEAVRFIDQNGDRQVRERVQEASGKLVSKYQQQQQQLPQTMNLLRDIQPRRNVIQINTSAAPVEIDFEESKDEILPQKGKRLRRVPDSPELEMLEQGDRTLRKRQRQM